MKASALFRVLTRQPLAYSVVRQNGSHRTLESLDYPRLTFAFHDGATVPPGLVRKILTKDVGLSDDDALGLLGR
ncbi:type II toxin-antitoxin system HicA family toxin [Spongisporangium articulatum]|uniref:Type II toxin-antitoxin system HicA family toxin n=1 Tax=Spongisporangium articulatum TaxID=3362603 RepID=A0ABW8AIS1_9ACTN